MLVIPKTAVLHRDTAAPTHPSETSGAAEGQSLATAPAEPVLVTEGQVMFATAAALGASRPSTAARPWIGTLWHRLVRGVSVERQPRRRYPPRRLSYFEQAATAREMDRL
jgi:hypothetical protein